MAWADYSNNPANNTVKPGIDWSEGMLPSNVNNSARQMMADTAVWLSAPTFSSLVMAGNGINISAGGLSVSGGAVFNNTLNVIGALTQNGNQVWHAGNFNPSGYQTALGYTPVNKAGDTLTGNLNGSFRATQQYVPTSGAGLEMAYTGTTGFVQCYDRDASAYRNLNLTAAAISLNPQSGSATVNGVLAVTGNETIGGSLSVSGAITRAGNQVWDAANFNPANYALLSGATFTGAFGRDSLFTMDIVGANPRITFDTGDYLVYDRTNNKFVFYAGNTSVASIDASGNLRMRGNVIANTTP